MMELLEAIRQSQMLHRLGWALIHTVWAGAGVALAFAIVLLILRRRSANARYLAGCAALAMMAALPLVIFLGTGPPRSAFQEAGSPEPLGHPASVELAATPLDADESQPMPAGADGPIQAAADAPLLTRATHALEPALPWVVLTWATGVFLLSLWQLGGWFAAGRLRGLATQPGETDVIGTVAWLARALRISRPVKVLVSTLVRVPTVVGWLRPVILMPAGLATGLSAQQLQAILAHELAHIRRYDYLVNLLQSAVETLLFYHPAVWFISRRIRAERENCCDDVALAAGAEPLSYAESLVRVARRSAAPAGRGRPAVAPGLGATGRPSQLGGRIRRLLGAGREETGRFSRGWPIGLAFLGAVLAGTCLLMNVEAETPGRTEKAGSPAPTGAGSKEASTQPAGPFASVEVLGKPGEPAKGSTSWTIRPSVGTRLQISRFTLDERSGEVHYSGDYVSNIKLAVPLKLTMKVSAKQGRIICDLRLAKRDDPVPALVSGRIDDAGGKESVPKIVFNRQLDRLTQNYCILWHVRYYQAGQPISAYVCVARVAPDQRADGPPRPTEEQLRRALVGTNMPATQPGKATFGPVMERLVNDDGEGKDCLIELDTGRLYSPPRHVKGKDKIAAWFREKGIDAGAETNPAGAGLWGLEMVVIPVASKLWDEDPLLGIRDELERGKPGTPAVMSALGNLPRTYVFKTREGGIGALQVLEVSNATRPRHIKIRWKMLKAARPRAPVTQPAWKSALEVSDIRFDPIGQEKNTLHVKVRNTSGKKQTLAVHIYTRRRIGWGQPTFAVLEPRQTRPMSIPFVIQEPVTDQTWIRLRFYNPTSAAEYDYEEQRILEKRYEASGLRRRAAAKAGRPASKDKAEEIKKAFLEVQAHIRDQKYKQAWQCLAKEYQKLAFYEFSSFEGSMKEESPLFQWSRPQFLELRPQQVTQREGVHGLAAARAGQTWTIDFVRENGRWKVEWVRGYTRRIDHLVYWQKRLLPKMRKHTTKHFDVYCFKGSTAEKEIDKILKEKEAGHRKICEFLGRISDVRIRLVLFEDQRTKRQETGHQGMGWATGTTIVEVYGDEGKLDPYHETAHILMRSVGSPPAILNEGFAVYMSERLGAAALKNLGGDKLSVYAKAKQIRQKGKWIPLRELLTYTEIGSRKSRPEVSYAQAGAFVKFLIDKHGKGKFLQAYKALKNSSELAVRQRNQKTLEKICGQALDRLERDWIKTVMSTP